MTLNTLIDPSYLYIAVYKSVDFDRPWFTGDIFKNIVIPEMEKSLAVMIIAHPCAMRGKEGALQEKILVSPVDKHDRLSERRWSTGHYSRMPLPGLPIQGDHHAAQFDQIAPARRSQFSDTKRIACLSHDGINHLQQRLIFYLTRFDVPIGNLQKEFSHTYVEADLLEEWRKQLAETCKNRIAKFEEWIRDGTPSRQECLKDEEKRHSVRAEMREEIKKLKEEASTNQDKTQ